MERIQCWNHCDDLSVTETLISMLAAIRQTEDSSELMEKTVLKLRVDQKGSKSSRVGRISLTARCIISAENATFPCPH